ncbi:hypothetical protein J6590_028053 [Homalodisca vitripennis]|nr:hypothetical protein J6590_028053 [Homalodisca vitripennis]
MSSSKIDMINNAKERLTGCQSAVLKGLSCQSRNHQESDISHIADLEEANSRVISSRSVITITARLIFREEAIIRVIYPRSLIMITARLICQL